MSRHEREEIAAMVRRVDAANVTGAGYTPRLRALERHVDASTPDTFEAALAELERGWFTEIARARRIEAQGGSR